MYIGNKKKYIVIVRGSVWFNPLSTTTSHFLENWLQNQPRGTI